MPLFTLYKFTAMPSLPMTRELWPTLPAIKKAESAFKAGADAANVANSRGLDPHSENRMIRANVGDISGVEAPPQFRKEIGIAGTPSTYGSAQGELHVRHAVSQRLNTLLPEINTDANSIVLETGKAAIATLCELLQSGDLKPKIIGPEPSYPMYQENTQYYKGNYASYKLVMGEDQKMHVDFESLQTQLQSNPGPKVLVINDIHNPTGHKWSKEEVATLEYLLREHPDTVIIFDTAYEAVQFSENKTSNLSPLMGKLWEAGRAIVCHSFSKELCVTGERLGALSIPANLIITGTNDQSFYDMFVSKSGNTHSNPPRLAYERLEMALKDKDLQPMIDRNNTELKERASVLVSGLKALGFACEMPEGGFYVWANADTVMKKLGISDVEIFRHALLTGPAISVCSDIHFVVQKTTSTPPHFIRFAFSSMTKEDIYLLLERLKEWLPRRETAINYFQQKPATIIGGGPVGQILAHKLTQAGAPTTLVSAHSYTPLIQKGITISFPIESQAFPTVVQTTRDAARHQPLQTILIATKLGDPTEQNIQELLALKAEGKLTNQTIIIIAQNGVGTAAPFTKAFPDNPIGKMVISVQIRADGKGGYSVPKEISWTIGHVSGDKTSVSDCAQSLSAMDVYKADMISREELETQEWIKLAKNLANLGLLSILANGGNAKTYADLLQNTPEGHQARNAVKIAVNELVQLSKLELDPKALYQEVLRYVATDHVCTTLANMEKGTPVEDLLDNLQVPKGSMLDQFTEKVKAYNVSMVPQRLVEVVPKKEIPQRLEACLKE